MGFLPRRLLIPFANIFDPDYALQNVGPDLDTQMVFLNIFFFEKVDFKKISRQQNSMKTFPGCKDLGAHSKGRFSSSTSQRFKQMAADVNFDPKFYKLHGLMTVGTPRAQQLLLSDAQIRKMGRWISVIQELQAHCFSLN